jgi:hypothetical protein
LDLGAIRYNFTLTTFTALGWGSSLRIGFLSLSLRVFFLFGSVETLITFTFAFLLNLLLFLFVGYVANGVLEFEKTFVADFKRASTSLTVLHGAEVQISERCNLIFREHCIDVDQNRDALVLLVLVSFKNVEGNIGSALVGLELDFLLGKEADYNIDFLIRLKTTDHWFNCKDFLSFLLDREVEFYGVLTLVL